MRTDTLNSSMYRGSKYSLVILDSGCGTFDRTVQRIKRIMSNCAFHAFPCVVGDWLGLIEACAKIFAYKSQSPQVRTRTFLFFPFP